MRCAVRSRDVWCWLAIGVLAFPLAAGVLARDDAPQETPAAEDADPPAETSSADDADQPNPDAAEDAQPEASTEKPAADEASGEPDTLPATPAADRRLNKKFPRKPLQEGLLTTAESEVPATETDVQTASMKGIQPGKTTREELHAKWGTPKSVEKVAGGARETFELEPFDRVRVTVIENVVESLAIRLEKPLEVAAVAKRMELDDVEPVQVFDDAGQLLGQAYPERGVLFGFAPQPQTPHVFQVVVEPIDAQAFLDRAEMRLPNRYADCLADIKQALELGSEGGRVHWLHARLALAAGELQQALKSAQKAIELEPAEGEYHLTLAKVLAATADYPHAIRQLRDLVESQKASPIVAAKATCQLGDCVAAAPERDYPQALKHHMDAAKMAEALVTNPNVSVRRAAKQLMVDTHLALAHDVGWGRWQHKAKVVPKWIERANTFADELIAREQGSLDVRLQVCEGALSALAGVADPPDPTGWIRGTTETGSKILEQASDTGYKSQVAWRLGVALTDAMEVEAMRGLPEKAFTLGKLALDNFQLGDPAGRELPTHDFIRGKLYFRVGAIYSIERADHKQALTWFDQAVPLLESPVPTCAAVDMGRHGEAFVSMAVSYWDANNRREALRLTQQGAKLMEQAASEGLLSKAGLAVPYSNLASMHEQLGELKEAKQYAEMAARLEEAPPK